MKKLLAVVFCSHVIVAYGQQKVTGGPGYGIRIEAVSGGPNNMTVYNGHYNEVQVSIQDNDPDSEYYTVVVKLAGKEVGRKKVDVLRGGKISIPMDTVHLPYGGYELTASYSWRTSSYSILVRDAPPPTPQPTDSLALVYPGIQPALFLDYYPNPTRDILYIDGMFPSESKYEVHIFDLRGIEMPVSNVSRYKSLLIVPIENIPTGCYSLVVSSRERITKRLLQVIK